jgi:formylglycine-generating enzyme required for sulfatase activity
LTLYPKQGYYDPSVVLDMAGNAWEWVADWYGNNYYADSPDDNPLGPDTGASKVLRGGSWGNLWHYLRAAVRNHLFVPENANFEVGFRCAAGSTEE